MTTTTRPRLKVRFDEEIRPALKEELGLENIMQVPRLAKIVLNSGVGRATQQASLLEGAQRAASAGREVLTFTRRQAALGAGRSGSPPDL